MMYKRRINFLCVYTGFHYLYSSYLCVSILMGHDVTEYWPKSQKCRKKCSPPAFLPFCCGPIFV